MHEATHLPTHRALLALGAIAIALELAACGDDTSSQVEEQTGDGDGSGDRDAAVDGQVSDTKPSDGAAPDGEDVSTDSGLDAGAQPDASADAERPEETIESGVDHPDASIPLAPKIDAITPARVAPGHRITIAGVMLDSVVRVWFGDVEATPAIASEDAITVVVPALPFGAVEVAVESAAGRSNPLTLTVAALPIIDRLLPADNPAGGPVLIRGQHLEQVQTVTFGGVPTDITIFSDNEIAVHVPADIAIGMTEVQVSTLQDASRTTPFEILEDYPPGPASPPDIIQITQPNRHTFPPVTNGWESDSCRYNASFSCDGTDTLQSVSVAEICGSGGSTGYGSGLWDTENLTVALSIERPSGIEQYEGAFVMSDITSVVLFSVQTGRQLNLTIGTGGYEPCDTPSGTFSCECGDAYLCGNYGYIGQACIEQQCQRCAQQ